MIGYDDLGRPYRPESADRGHGVYHEDRRGEDGPPCVPPLADLQRPGVPEASAGEPTHIAPTEQASGDGPTHTAPSPLRQAIGNRIGLTWDSGAGMWRALGERLHAAVAQSVQEQAKADADGPPCTPPPAPKPEPSPAHQAIGNRIGLTWDSGAGKWRDQGHRAHRDRCLIGYDAAVAQSVEAPAGAKPTNPKQACGERKAPITTVSAQVMTEVGLAMLEGARKYGRHNYRAAGVRYSTYLDAVWRHLFLQWWDQGENQDADSGLSHVTKAIACLCVLRDSMLQNNGTDDRPPRAQSSVALLNADAAAIVDRVRPGNPAEAYTQANESEWATMVTGGAK